MLRSILYLRLSQVKKPLRFVRHHPKSDRLAESSGILCQYLLWELPIGAVSERMPVLNC